MNELDLSNETLRDTLANDALLVDPIVKPAAIIAATMQPAVNMALWQNHVPVTDRTKFNGHLSGDGRGCHH